MRLIDSHRMRGHRRLPPLAAATEAVEHPLDVDYVFAARLGARPEPDGSLRFRWGMRTGIEGRSAIAEWLCWVADAFTSWDA